MPHNLSIEEFCLKQGVPVNDFNKWYRNTHKRIHPIHVEGMPSSEPEEATPQDCHSDRDGIRITATFCMNNGLHIRQENLSYDGLVKFVGKLEGLC